MDRRQPGRSRVLSGRRATARPSVRSARIHTRSSCAGPATARRRSTNWTTREWLSSECDRRPRRLCVRAADRYATTNVGCRSIRDRVGPFLSSQLGLRLGSRLDETLRERAEQLAGLALLGLAILLIVEQVG